MIVEGILAIAIGWYLVVKGTWSPRNAMDLNHERDMDENGIYTKPMTSRVVSMGQGLPGYVAPPNFGNKGRHHDSALDAIRATCISTANTRRNLFLDAARNTGAGGGFSNTVSGTQPDVLPFSKTYTSALPGTSLPGVHPGF